MLKILADEQTYEKRYRLLDAGYNKLITVSTALTHTHRLAATLIRLIWFGPQVLTQTRKLLETSKYDAMVDRFPAEDKLLVEAISVTLENTCLFGEMILHHPDMSYLILQRSRDGEWRHLINWCLKFARHFYGRIIDENAQILLSLMEQEINPEQRSPNFVNPYRKAKEPPGAEPKPTAKPKKKLKKGPQMSQRNEL